MSPAVKVGTAYVEVRGDFDGFDRDLQTQAKASSGKMRTFGAAGAAAGAALKAGMGLAVVGVGKQMISLGSDAQETASKFRTVFGRETENATRKLDAFSKASGTSKFALREQAAQFQALIRPMGLSSKAAGNMSVGMTKLATDLASFNNTSVEDAITALQSGLVGEAEPMRKFGVQLSAVRVEAYAYAKGIAKQGAELTAAQKAQASYGIIMQDTKLAQGDAVRTADSFANQLKRLKSQVIDGATALGVMMLPAATKVVGALTKLPAVVDAVKNAVGPIIERFRGVSTEGGRLSGIFDQLKTIWSQLGPMFVAIGGALSAAWERFGGVILDEVRNKLQLLQGVFQGIITIFQGIIAVITGVLTGDWAKAWDGIKLIFQGVMGVLVSIVTSTWETLKNVFRLGLLALETIVKAAAQPFIDLGKWLVNRVIEGIMSMAAAVGNAAGWFKNRVVEYVQGLASAYTAVGTFVLRALVTGLTTVVEALTGFGGWLRNRISEAVRAVADGIGNIGGAVIGWITSGLRTATDGISGFGSWLADRLSNALGRAKEGITGIGSAVIGWIVDGFKAGANAIVSFLNSVLGKINSLMDKIGGPNIGAIDAFKDGGEFKARGLARGGAFARTGGWVNQPITLMGEEAPRHGEFVIPTNPRYRKRAQSLALAAMGAVGLGGATQGFDIGGIFGGIGNVVSDAFGKVKDVLGVALPDIPKMATWAGAIVKAVIKALLPWSEKHAGPVRKALKYASDKSNYGPYHYGGGHGGWGSGPPFDCSGWVSHVIHAGWPDKISAPMAVAQGTGLYTLGTGGDGRTMTWGVRGSSGKQAHTMISLKDGDDWRYFESSGAGTGERSGWSGSFQHRHLQGFRMGGKWGTNGNVLGYPLSSDIGQALINQLGWGLARGGVHGPFAGTFHDGGVVMRNGLANVQQGERVLAADDIVELRIDPAMDWLRQFIHVEVVKRERDRGGAVAQGVSR